MALVEYSESSDSEDQNTSTTGDFSRHNDDQGHSPQSKKRKRVEEGEKYPSHEDKSTRSLPPLPSALRDLYATNVRSSIGDDPELHGGKRRQIPHVEGKWPTHVYLEYVRAFNVTVSSIDWVPNFERNRYFLVLRVKKPDNDELNKLLAACNASALAYEQPPLYNITNMNKNAPLGSIRKRRDEKDSLSRSLTDCSDSFHISIAWSLQERAMTATERTLTEASRLDSLDIRFESIKSKVGNVIESISLGQTETAGIGGL
ncbi:MAG: hypothetical protein Q9227_009162 [Pyrenula ochraceoflavens]